MGAYQSLAIPADCCEIIWGEDEKALVRFQALPIANARRIGDNYEITVRGDKRAEVWYDSKTNDYWWSTVSLSKAEQETLRKLQRGVVPEMTLYTWAQSMDTLAYAKPHPQAPEKPSMEDVPEEPAGLLTEYTDRRKDLENVVESMRATTYNETQVRRMNDLVPLVHSLGQQWDAYCEKRDRVVQWNASLMAEYTPRKKAYERIEKAVSTHNERVALAESAIYQAVRAQITKCRTTYLRASLLKPFTFRTRALSVNLQPVSGSVKLPLAPTGERECGTPFPVIPKKRELPVLEWELCHGASHSKKMHEHPPPPEDTTPPPPKEKKPPPKDTTPPPVVVEKDPEPPKKDPEPTKKDPEPPKKDPEPTKKDPEPGKKTPKTPKTKTPRPSRNGGLNVKPMFSATTQPLIEVLNLNYEELEKAMQTLTFLRPKIDILIGDIDVTAGKAVEEQQIHKDAFALQFALLMQEHVSKIRKDDFALQFGLIMEETASDDQSKKVPLETIQNYVIYRLFKERQVVTKNDRSNEVYPFYEFLFDPLGEWRNKKTKKTRKVLPMYVAELKKLIAVELPSDSKRVKVLEQRLDKIVESLTRNVPLSGAPDTDDSDTSSSSSHSSDGEEESSSSGDEQEDV